MIDLFIHCSANILWAPAMHRWRSDEQDRQNPFPDSVSLCVYVYMHTCKYYLVNQYYEEIK